LVAAVLVAAGTSEYARAQDDQEADERILAGPGDVLEPHLAQKQLSRMRAALLQQLNQLSASQSPSPFLAAASVRRRLEMILAGRLERQREDCNLTEAQMAKLRLAGRGDIKRFLDRLDGIARILGDRQTNFDELRKAERELTEAANALENGFFREDSLFYKVLARQLNQEQFGDREKALTELNRRRYEKLVSQAVNTMQGILGLTDQQRAKLTDLLLGNTLPPRRFGKASDIAVVLFQASKIPDELIRPVFSDAQWRTMSAWLSRYKNGAGLEGALRIHGFIFDADPVLHRPVPVSTAPAL
jgi:hypothetical protein